MKNQQSKPNKSGRWRIVALTIFAGTALALFAAGMLLNTMSLSPELLDPPAETLKEFRIADGPGREQRAGSIDPRGRFSLPPKVDRNNGPWGYREYVVWLQEKYPGAPGADVYLRWSDGLDLNDFIEKYLLYLKRDLWRECLVEGKPFPSDLEQWLLDNQDYLETIRRLAAEGIPGPSQEDAREMSGEDLTQIPILNFLQSQTSARILGAEALRLLLAGDEVGVLWVRAGE